MDGNKNSQIYQSNFSGPTSKKRKRSSKEICESSLEDSFLPDDPFNTEENEFPGLRSISSSNSSNLREISNSFDPFMEEDLFGGGGVVGGRGGGVVGSSFGNEDFNSGSYQTMMIGQQQQRMNNFEQHVQHRFPPVLMTNNNNNNNNNMINAISRNRNRGNVTMSNPTGSGKSKTIFCLFGEDSDSGNRLYNFKPRLEISLEGLKYDSGHNWVKKGSYVKIICSIVGYTGIESIIKILSSLELSLIGSGLPQTYMSKKPYVVFQCLVNVGKKEDGLILSKTPSGVSVMEICKKEIVSNCKLVITAKLNVGTNVSGHWRYTNGYRFGFVFQNIFYVSLPFKVLSRKPSKKKSSPSSTIENMTIQNTNNTVIEEDNSDFLKKNFNLLKRNNRFLCFLYIQDSKNNRCVVEFPEVNKPNWISINNRQKLGQITLSSDGFIVSSNENNFEGNLILNNQTVKIYDSVNNNINVICTIGNSTTIKITNKPKWAVVFKSRNQIIQVLFPKKTIMIGRTSQFIPTQDLTNEEKASISRLHLKAETKIINEKDVLILTDCSKNGSKIMLPVNKAIFEEGVKYELQFKKNNTNNDPFVFTFFYSTQSLADDGTIDLDVNETDSFQKRTKEIIKELKELKI